MRAADDDSIPVPHDAFRVPRGALKWKAPYRTALLLIGGAYALLVLTGRLTPDVPEEMAAREPLQLPLPAQLALGALGLAALVLVLSRAVREVDKRPYVAVAPVFATFAALVHAGLRVDLSPLGTSSALVAIAVLAVALIGGALVVRTDVHAQRLGWGLVITPWLLLMAALQLAKGGAAFTSSERAYALGLLCSSLVLGAAGLASRTLRSALTRVATSGAKHADELPNLPTHVVPAPAAGAPAGLWHALRARIAPLPRGRARLVTALASAALIYFGLSAVWPSPAPQARAPARVVPAAAPRV
ncbi:MAG TPA: hypothetical protein VFZ61_26290, partial [Polyangiales bacterium]